MGVDGRRQRADALNEYWNLYIILAMEVLGIMATGKSFTSRGSVKWFITADVFGLRGGQSMGHA